MNPDRRTERLLFWPRHRKRLVADEDPPVLAWALGWLDKAVLSHVSLWGLRAPRYQGHVTGAVIVGGNPLLNGLAAASLAEADIPSVICHGRGGEHWPFELLRHPGVRSYLESLGETGRAAERQALANPLLPQLGSLERIEDEDSRSWLLDWFNRLGDRILRTGTEVLRLDAGHAPYLLERPGAEAVVCLDLAAPPSPAPALREVEEAADAAFAGGVLRRLPRLVLRPDLAAMLRKDRGAKAFLFAPRVVLTSGSARFARSEAETLPTGGVALRYDTKLLLPLGSARVLPADREAALREALTDLALAARVAAPRGEA